MISKEMKMNTEEENENESKVMWSGSVLSVYDAALKKRVLHLRETGNKCNDS